MSRAFGPFRRLKYAIPVVLALAFLSLTRYSDRRAPWYEQALWNLVAPPQMLIAAISRSIADAWNRYLFLVETSKTNEQLMARNAELQHKIVALQEVQGENERLRSLLQYSSQYATQSIMAKVIANDPQAEFHSIAIDRGRDDGVDVLMPVVGPAGIIGRVGKVSAHSALVLLLSDPNSTIDVMVQRSRQRGLLVGSAKGVELRRGAMLSRLEFVSSTSDIMDGDIVVTSGFDRIFPPGMPVGTVSEVLLAPSGIFHAAVVVPYETLTEVQEVAVLQRLSQPDGG